MMSKELKASVLAKCETCKINQGGWMPVGSENSGLACEYFREDGYAYFQIGSPNHAICLKFNEETHSESVVWPIAAQILGIGRFSIPDKVWEDNIKEGLKEAFIAGFSRFGNGLTVKILNIEEIAAAEYEKWLQRP